MIIEKSTACIDWSAVKLDTPILVSHDNVEWHKRHFACYIDGYVFAWTIGKTSFTVKHQNQVAKWEYAKLA